MLRSSTSNHKEELLMSPFMPPKQKRMPESLSLLAKRFSRISCKGSTWMDGAEDETGVLADPPRPRPGDGSNRVPLAVAPPTLY